MPELECPTLGDDVVILRPWTEADVPEVLTVFSDPAVQRFAWPHSHTYTEADAREFFAEQEAARLSGTELNFAFVDPADPGAVLGGGSLYDIDLEQDHAAVGYWLVADARGRGIATDAVLLMARWAFDCLGTARLALTCGPDNEASQRVALRCGFVREGVLRSYLPFKGGRRDTVIFSLLPTELAGIADPIGARRRHRPSQN